MKNNGSNKPQQQEQDPLLKEGRVEEESPSPFEQARQKLSNPTSPDDEAEAEQQHKEAMTERD